MVKLSELNDDVMVATMNSFSYVKPVLELKREVQSGVNVLEEGKWYTVVKRSWKPDARSMIEQYFERVFDDWPYNDLEYEELIDGVLRFLEEHMGRIQSILEDALKDCDVIKYWDHDEEIEFD
ncbi:MAG: hypothetical protein IMW85_00950 [Thermicanus sp.]|nr:hypothetical protein [Thermicanus sp.]